MYPQTQQRREDYFELSGAHVLRNPANFDFNSTPHHGFEPRPNTSTPLKIQGTPGCMDKNASTPLASNSRPQNMDNIKYPNRSYMNKPPFQIDNTINSSPGSRHCQHDMGTDQYQNPRGNLNINYDPNKTVPPLNSTSLNPGVNSSRPKHKDNVPSPSSMNNTQKGSADSNPRPQNLDIIGNPLLVPEWLDTPAVQAERGRINTPSKSGVYLARSNSQTAENPDPDGAQTDPEEQSKEIPWSGKIWF